LNLRSNGLSIYKIQSSTIKYQALITIWATSNRSKSGHLLPKLMKYSYKNCKLLKCKVQYFPIFLLILILLDICPIISSPTTGNINSLSFLNCFVKILIKVISTKSSLEFFFVYLEQSARAHYFSHASLAPPASLSIVF